MLKYIFKRILMMIPVILGIILLVFTIMSFSPGDPGSLILGPMATEEEIYEMNDSLGWYDPLPVRYVNYVLDMIRGDLGVSWINNLPVTQEIANKFPITLRLTVLSIILTVIVCIPLGVIAALKQYSIADNVSMFLALILSAMPVFWLGLMLILTFSLKLDMLPVTGADTWKHFILPTITTAAGTIAVCTRMTRTTMVEVLREDYIRTARAKGADEQRVVFKHALRNTLIPVITLLGINFGTMLGGTVLVETVFGMPGIGLLLVTAIRSKDIPVVLGATVVLAICFSIVNLLTDISYSIVDPRISKS